MDHTEDGVKYLPSKEKMKKVNLRTGIDFFQHILFIILMVIFLVQADKNWCSPKYIAVVSVAIFYTVVDLFFLCIEIVNLYKLR